MVLDPSVRIVLVSRQRIRQLFNDGQYLQRARSGEFRRIVITEYAANSSKTGQPKGTRTQMVAYVNSNDEEIALVHQYVKPDGSFGGSGQPDPKRLRQGDFLYLIDPDDPDGH